jgi:hypothetical protein
MSISLVNSIHPSETAPWRQALFDMSWRRWQVWLFTSVMSWALIPVVEELYFRGYCQRRLAEDWGDGPAIIGTACLFTFAHAQYLIANAYNLGMIAGLLMFAIGSGVALAWTRSLIPSIVIHAIMNFPMTSVWQGVLLAALVIGAVIGWRRGMAAFKRVFSTARAATCFVLGAVGAGFAILSARDEPWVYGAAIAMVVLAVVLEAIDRRRARAAEPAPASV